MQNNNNNSKHYSLNQRYDTVERFISYYYQTDIIAQLGVKTVLEIGIGNKTVCNYMKEHEYEIKTLDCDVSACPDIVGDIRNIPLQDNSFDVVLAAEIIEHIPWQDLDIAFSEIHRVSKKYAIVSTPYSSGSIEIIFASQIFQTLFQKSFFSFFIRIPKFWHKHKYNGKLSSHCWEMGRRGFSIFRLRKLINKKFKIIKELRPVMSCKLNHYFFILEKR